MMQGKDHLGAFDQIISRQILFMFVKKLQKSSETLQTFPVKWELILQIEIALQTKWMEKLT